MARADLPSSLTALAAGLALAACASPPPPAPAPVAATPATEALPADAPERTQGSAGRVLVYNAITGHVPVTQRTPSGLSEAGLEALRAAQLEAEIAEELSKQQDLSGLASPEGARSEPARPKAAPRAAGERSSPETDVAAAPPALGPDDLRLAPEAPSERDLPLSLFDAERVRIPRGTWGNDKAIEVVRRGRDVDGDGAYEEVRFYEPISGALLRREEDTDFDGRMDAWYRYEQDALVERVLDASGDGRSDTFERYAGGRMHERRLDRDDDGVPDAVYRYEGAELVEETHDADNDGRVDLRIRYEDLRRARAEEDRDRDGRMDTWTLFQTVDGRDHPARIERDSKGRGLPDIIETYEVLRGVAKLARREEDVDGDGKADVVSLYEDGKLVTREIANPDLVPL